MRRPPRSTRAARHFPYSTLFRSSTLPQRPSYRPGLQIASSRPLTQVALRAIAALQGLAETLRQKDGVQMGESLEITFHGAARPVTGSCMQLRYGDLAVLIDCGLFQGSRTLETLNREAFPFDASRLDRKSVVEG